MPIFLGSGGHERIERNPEPTTCWNRLNIAEETPALLLISCLQVFSDCCRIHSRRESGHLQELLDLRSNCNHACSLPEVERFDAKSVTTEDSFVARAIEDDQPPH